jgi:hypothetical protein
MDRGAIAKTRLGRGQIRHRIPDRGAKLGVLVPVEVQRHGLNVRNSQASPEIRHRHNLLIAEAEFIPVAALLRSPNLSSQTTINLVFRRAVFPPRTRKRPPAALQAPAFRPGPPRAVAWREPVQNTVRRTPKDSAYSTPISFPRMLARDLTDSGLLI